MPLLRSEEVSVADYLEREGLHETHLHLNGSTHAEICWLRAIRDKRAETRDFVAAWTRNKNSDRVRELVKQSNPELTPQVFQQHLRLSGRLRAWLAAAAEDRIAPDAQLPRCCQSLNDAADNEWSSGLRLPISSWRHVHDVADKLTWMARLLDRLRQRPSIQLSQMLHAYLLLLSEYFRLSLPAAMGSSLPIMVTKRAGQIEHKQVIKCSAVFQLVFQIKAKIGINVINK